MDERLVAAGFLMCISTGVVDVLVQDILQLHLSDSARYGLLVPYVLSLVTGVTGLVTSPSSRPVYQAV